ncbi:hypothetical protein AB0M92_18795 [Streptomyces sp. NPDC051582]|uniref:hypothetical protein n=1 Tax=Streptomyces sp. NPDC051582 TaxID=3155167 RepID=UPI0034401DC6
MNGPQHYIEGERHLSAASHLDRPGGKPTDPSASAYHLMAAQAHFAGAQAAAAAGLLADKYAGDGAHINEWRAAIAATKKVNDDPWVGQPDPYIPGQPYSPPVEMALRNLNLAGYVTPADTLIAASHVIAGHIAEALSPPEGEEVKNWARSIANELKRIGLDLRGAIERRAEDLNDGTPFAYSEEPPF